ncbi:MAG: GTP-binding protein [Euryarchaeota archaeon]|nr:GTP-binding protein [Euryarchaeota archaeon]
MKELLKLAGRGEGGNLEFKRCLSRRVHLQRDRKQSLACQLRYRAANGSGRAVYLIGVDDSGQVHGLSREELEESVEVLSEIASEAGFTVTRRKDYAMNGRYCAMLVLERSRLEKEHLLVAIAGHVDHGKSTLVGTLVSGELDDGSGRTRRYLDTRKHEIERGLSADLSYAVYGFTSSGEPVRLRNPLSKRERAEVVSRAAKLVSFVDTVGHEPWLRTTIRGIVGQKLDYGILTVAANEGITHITKEHLGIMLAMDLPVIVVITKSDLVEDVAELQRELSRLLALVGRVPKFIDSPRDLEQLGNFWQTGALVPVLAVSAVTGEKLELLERLLYMLPKRVSQPERSAEFLMYIDKIYRVPGAGTVVSGSVKRGSVRRGERLYLGPDADGRFHRVRSTSIEVHHLSVENAEVGEVVGIAIKGTELEPRRGMVLSSAELRAAKSFTAEVVVLNHPTRVAAGYEPVVHLETISEAVVLEPLEREYLAAGDRGRVRMTFKYHPHYVEVGQRFVFREGRSKGIGVVTEVHYT